jgi:hypothetical protein
LDIRVSSLWAGRMRERNGFFTIAVIIHEPFFNYE